MTDWHKITIPGLPVAQPRQRHRIVTSGGRSFASNYTPGKHPVNAFKAAVAAEAGKVGAPMSTGPVWLWVRFVFPRPKSKCRKRDALHELPHTSKPDIDNLLKSVKDAMTGIAWRDDAQVCHVDAVKVVAPVGVAGSTEIEWGESE